jgi:hypothetical protein
MDEIRPPIVERWSARFGFGEEKSAVGPIAYTRCMSTTAWELIFMMLVLKIPIVYLIGVVWWAIRATPDPYEPAALVPAEPEEPRLPAAPCPWRARRRGAPVRPRGGRDRVRAARAMR